MRDRLAVLIDDEDHRQTRIEQLLRALCRTLWLNRLECFLERNDGQDGRDNIFAVHDRGRDRYGDLSSRANHLRSSDDDAATTKLRQHIRDSLIDLFPLNQINLEGAMHFAPDWTDRQGQQVRIVLQTPLQA